MPCYDECITRLEAFSMDKKIEAIENTKFIHIPGPNPLLVQGEKGAWDEEKLEVCDILKDEGKYYLYYHASGGGFGYRIGVAVADSPLGPFEKYGDKPILDLQNFGHGNDNYIACGSILKEGTDQYYLYYSLQQKDDPWNYYIGLATANHPLGPWKKHENNPIMQNFGYVGGITKKDGKYYMFNEYPTRIQADDYGTISVAVADAPEGPWTPCREHPVLDVEDWGTWDDAGYSECNVKYDGNLFHMFYGGAKTNKIRLCSKESIGYAYSTDGKHFTKYSFNPVAHRESVAFGAAMAEVCFLPEYPYIYLYHTLRYTKPWRKEDEPIFPLVEHIGAEVLCVADKFNVSYPVYTLNELKPNESAKDLSKLPLTVAEAKEMAITVSCSYSEKASHPLNIRLYTATNPEEFDTIPYKTFTLNLAPGKKIQQTFRTDICAKFLCIVAENPDPVASVSDISVSATLKN